MSNRNAHLARRSSVALVAGVLLFAACSSDDNGSTSATEATLATTAAPSDTAPSASDQVSSTVDQIDAALKDGPYATISEILHLTGISDQLEGREVTLLAPTEDAFKALSGSQLKDLIANPTQIDDLLKRHVIDGAYTYDELAQQQTVKAMDGTTLNVTDEGGTLKVDGATVEKIDKAQANGDNGDAKVVVLSIDALLLGGGGGS
jgi:uncharacterized surface protein with fasciclin (FAS1) repeats